MKKNWFTENEVLRLTPMELTMVAIILLIIAVATVPKLIEPKSENVVITTDVVMTTEKSYDWGYPFPPAEEFGESDHYSMVWIGEWGWIWKRFLLVRAKEVHRDYGRLPYLLQAIKMVERKYTIVSKEFLTTDPRLTDSGLIDSLLLEIRPPENTENIEKRHP